MDEIQKLKAKGIQAKADAEKRDLKPEEQTELENVTTEWAAVAGSWDAPDDGVARAIERLGRPSVIFGQELVDGAFDDRDEMAGMIESPRKLAHRMQRDGYLLKRRPDGDRWQFSVDGRVFRSRLAFVRAGLLDDAAATELAIEDRGRQLAAGVSVPADHAKIEAARRAS